VVSTITTDRQHDIYDEVNQNFILALRDIANFQPQYLQLISNPQVDFIQTTKNMIQNTTSAQKQMAGCSNNFNLPPLFSTSLPYMESFKGN
jgi:hypothetical protein